MRFRGLDLNLIVSLDALLSERNVSLAARRVFVTQPAMSRSLARLRQHFNDDLLLQIGRRMILTAFGEGLVEPVHQLLAHVEATLGCDAVFDPKTSKRNFTIFALDYLNENLTPSIIGRISRAAPNVTIRLVSDVHPGELIENGTIDLAIHGEKNLSRLHPAEHLFDEPYAVVGWNENPSLAGPLALKDFMALGRVVIRVGPHRSLTFAESQVQEALRFNRTELVTYSYPSMPKLLIGTNRVALMPRQLAASYAERMPLALLDPPFDVLPLRVMMQSHSLRQADAGMIWIKNIVREEVARDKAISQACKQLA